MPGRDNRVEYRNNKFIGKGSAVNILCCLPIEANIMLSGKRATRVGDQILRFIAELLIERIRDPRLSKVTLTDISLSNDLKNARIYFSVLGTEMEVKEALNGLESAKGFIKRELGKRSQLRYVPDIIFDHDPTLETGNRLEQLFKKIEAEKEV